MATKIGTLNQHEFLHDHYGQDDCFLCRVERERDEATAECEEWVKQANAAAEQRDFFSEKLVAAEARIKRASSILNAQKKSQIKASKKVAIDRVLAALKGNDDG